MKKGDSKNRVNLVKYTAVVALISFFWAFVGGFIIALNRKEFLTTGAFVFFFGIIVTYFLFDYFVKTKKWKWILKKS